VRSAAIFIFLLNLNSIFSAQAQPVESVVNCEFLAQISESGPWCKAADAILAELEDMPSLARECWNVALEDADSANISL
jgi:hypothetical protein